MNMPSRLKAAASLVIAFLLCAFSPSCGTQATKTAKGSLPWVSLKGGKLVVSSTGKPVTLRGVNLAFYLDITPIDRYVTEKSIGELADRGVNLVRVCFHWRQVGPQPEDRAWLKRLVGWCAENGIYAVLGMHVPPGEEDIDPITGEFWDSPDNADDLVGLWKLIAGEFEGEPAVLGYDIFNEPTPPEPDRWWDLAGRLVNSIEEVDSRHLIIVEPDLTGYKLRDLGDPRVLYSPHYYEPMVVSHRGEYWYGDTPARTDVDYPGDIPDELEYISQAEPTEALTEPTGAWHEVSATASVPAGVDVAMVSLFGWTGPLGVFFDDVSVSVNDVPRRVVNGDMSEESESRKGMPRAWFISKEDASTFTAGLDREEGHSKPGSLHVKGEGEWFSCGQDEGVQFDSVFIRVRPGDRVSVSAWVKAPRLYGETGVTVDWCRETRKVWDREVIERDTLKAFGEWALKHDTTLFIGEFGSMSREGDAASANLVSDTMSVWNERGYAWTMYCYRGEYIAPGSDSFGFGLINCPNAGSPDAGYTWRRELADPWSRALREK